VRVRERSELDGLQVVQARVAELRENPENPRSISEPRLDALTRSIDADPAMLAARPLIALPDGTVIAGNMRLRAAKALGWETIPVVYADLDPQRARLWLLRDNNPYGEWDEAGVSSLLAELAAAGEELELTGFGVEDLDRLLADLADDGDGAGTDEYALLALAQATVGPPRHEVTTGEAWRLSERHTLVVAGVYDGAALWSPFLAGHALFIPYPTPMLPLTEKAEELTLLLVQPNPYLAGHLLDRYEDQHGPEALRRIDG
jgi:ParB-like nuclease domain